MAIIMAHFPRIGIEEQEADHVQVVQGFHLTHRHHAADMPCHVQHQAVAEDFATLVLNFYGHYVIGLLLATINRIVLLQQHIGFRAPETKLAGNLNALNNFFIFFHIIQSYL